jgi:hypothetical protein
VTSRPGFVELMAQGSPAFRQLNAALLGAPQRAVPAPQDAFDGVVLTKTPVALQAPVKRKGTRVPRTRNGGTWTEAEYWGHLRSALRKLSRFWKPAQAALRAARVAYPGPRGAKWAFRCARCNQLFRRPHVAIDHLVPAGELTSFDHLPGFVLRLLPEDPRAFQVLCLRCHQDKTNAERL